MGGGVRADGYEASPWNDENNLELSSGDGCTILGIYENH